MKQASRFMPRYTPKKTNKIGFFGLGFIGLAIIIYEPVIIGVVAAIAFIAFIWSCIERPKVERYFQSLRHERKGLAICEFAAEFDARKIDTWIIRAVYEQLQDAIPTSHQVPIKASDHLFEILMLDEDDLDLDIVEEIACRTGRSLENYESNPFCGKVTTVRNLVLFFNNQPIVNVA